MVTKKLTDKQRRAHHAYRRMCYVEMMKPNGSHPICYTHHSPNWSQEQKAAFKASFDYWNPSGRTALNPNLATLIRNYV